MYKWNLNVNDMLCRKKKPSIYNLSLFSSSLVEICRIFFCVLNFVVGYKTPTDPDPYLEKKKKKKKKKKI